MDHWQARLRGPRLMAREPAGRLNAHRSFLMTAGIRAAESCFIERLRRTMAVQAFVDASIGRIQPRSNEGIRVAVSVIVDMSLNEVEEEVLKLADVSSKYLIVQIDIMEIVATLGSDFSEQSRVDRQIPFVIFRLSRGVDASIDLSEQIGGQGIECSRGQLAGAMLKCGLFFGTILRDVLIALFAVRARPV